MPLVGRFIRASRRLWFAAKFAALSLLSRSQHVTPAIEGLCRREIASGNAGQLPRFLLAHALADDSRFTEAKDEFRLLIDAGDSRDSVVQRMAEVCYRVADFSNAVHYLTRMKTHSMTKRTFEFLLGMSRLGLK